MSKKIVTVEIEVDTTLVGEELVDYLTNDEEVELHDYIGMNGLTLDKQYE